IIANSEGARTTPSVIAFSPSGEKLVGQIARRQSVTNPENTIYAVKRLIGRRFDSDETKRFASFAPFSIENAENGDAWVKVGDRTYSPQEISAMVLAKMKDTASEFLGEPVEDAVITVPAHFGDTKRKATEDAGRIAQLIDESSEYGYRIKGHLSLTGEDSIAGSPYPIVGQGDDLKHFLDREAVDEVIFAAPYLQVLQNEHLIRLCDEIGIKIHIKLDRMGTLLSRTYPTQLGEYPMLTLTSTPYDAMDVLLKRIVDLSVSATAFGRSRRLTSRSSMSPSDSWSFPSRSTSRPAPFSMR
ncbi:MAG: Hsp70 family protein, partial [Proteobacteria bacterium]|nr:Hsp70 family protein [Pseudomonadota bacterium]